MLRIIIAGSRDFDDYEMLKSALDNYLFHNSKEVQIVSGGSSGADKLGERYAKENNFQLKVFPADWKSHGKSAGPIRNRLMAENADVLFAFWNGKSVGTADMITRASKKGLEVLIIRTD
ncbi:MAG: DUF2493 domain-containing protein [Flavobacteriia bacterium]|jgi:hypothetical protein